MKIGTPLWVSKDGSWYAAKVTQIESDDSKIMKVQCAISPDGRQEEMGMTAQSQIEASVWATLNEISARDPSVKYHEVSDLSTLMLLNEASMLQILHERSALGYMYTSTGSVLLAVNPFRHLELYHDDIKGQHCHCDQLRTARPHIFGVANAAYWKMRMGKRGSSCNQTILVNGESGSGKTESTKLIMNQLAFISLRQRRAVRMAQNEVYCRVLESNPILESFGNASTKHNNNSSRFGKFIKLAFSATSGELLGASIATYLLERVRIVSQAKRERNYHIFYELCCGSTQEELRNLNLSTDLCTYNYLNSSAHFERMDGVSDKASYNRIRVALEKIGINSAEQFEVMKVVAAVLHCGNIVLCNGDSDGSSRLDLADKNSAESINSVCDLLCIGKESLQKTLCTRHIRAGLEYVTVCLPVNQAILARDAMAKTLYDRLFSWLVKRINASMRYEEEEYQNQYIGLVDIFGFEIFEHNSLEQLCINFANEKLQQLFGNFVFKVQQNIYIEEGVAWEKIDYPNNDNCVQLFETKPFGIFALLDEQCMIPRGRDGNLSNKYNECLSKSRSFSVSSLQQGKGQFVVKHYAGSVCYETQGLCEKNKDRVHLNVLELMESSESKLVRQLFEEPDFSLKAQSSTRLQSEGRRSSTISSTVTKHFNGQLHTLLNAISSTEPHFVRCIKPNDTASPTAFDRKRVIEQLRCSGVLEAVKIARSGYPIRLEHHAFVHAYSCIIGYKSNEVKITMGYLETLCENLIARLALRKFNAQLEPIQLGRSKVFCLSEVHDKLEAARGEALLTIVARLQCAVRGYLTRRRYKAQIQSAFLIQSFWRSHCCRKSYRRLLYLHHSAIKLQSVYRGHSARESYLKNRASVKIQCLFRGWLVRVQSTANMSKSVSPEVPEADICGSPENNSFKDYDTRRTSGISTDLGSDDTELIDSKAADNEVFSPFRSTPLKKQVKEYDFETPRYTNTEYDITWECGLLGLYFESDQKTGMPTVRRVHESLSNCGDIFEVSRGDVLLTVNSIRVRSGDIRNTLSLLQEIRKPVRLHFKRNAVPRAARRKDSLEVLGEEEYEVLWKDGMPLGLGFRPCPDTGLPAIIRGTGNHKLPGMFNVRAGDHLIFINEFSTNGVQFNSVIDILESGPRPVVLRFRHNNVVDEFHELPRESSRPIDRPTCLSLNPKLDHSLYYITWKEEDGPLGVVVKQENGYSYPCVISVKNEGAVIRASQKNRVEIGDLLLSINNNNISKMGFGAAIRLLQNGPKPLLLMFQRPRLSYAFSTTSYGN